MWIKLSLVILLCLVCYPQKTESQQSDSGYRLAREASYFIAAPKHVRANQVVQMSVSVMKMYYDSLSIRAIIRRNGEQIVSAEEVFDQTGLRHLQLWIPESAEQGNWTLRVEGSNAASGLGVGGVIFENETRLEFEPKQTSIFIQLSKQLFRQGQTVYFRIMPVQPNLMSRTVSMNILIKDPTGTTVRRWLSMQTNAGGVLDMEFQLSEQPTYGDWKVVIQSLGHTYEKTFQVDEFWITAIDVNVSMPIQIQDDEFGIAGVISANLSLGQPVKGTVKSFLELRLPPGEQEDGKEYDWPRLYTPERYFGGVIDFMYTVADMLKLLEDSDLFPRPKTLQGKEIYVEAEVDDWFLLQQATGSAMSMVHGNQVELILMGDSARTFKPGQTMYVYWAVSMRDGTPIHRLRRQVTIVGTEQTTSGTHSFEERQMVADDGIARFRYTPRDDATFIRIQASYDTMTTRSQELTATRVYSPTESFISVTTSTEDPIVDNYMVFTVTTNTFIERLYYMVTAAGNIVMSNFIEMDSRQRTFSLSLSRDMTPEAHLVVWHIWQGEVIADSLNFFVNGTRINTVDARFNRGKDFTGDTVEITAITDPSSFVGFSGLDYELWAYGWGTFITETEVVEEMRTFDAHVNSSYHHKWRLPEEQSKLIHFPSPSYGIDANTTFEYAGLYVFTDANVTRLPHNCNWTMGFFPCMDGSCYTTEQWCDGVRQCIDGQDEMGCERTWEYEVGQTPVKHRLGLVTRHYVMEGQWLWGSHFVMPNGRLDMQVEVPDEPMSWVAAGYAISRNLGFGYTNYPLRHQATRPFYMRAEAPESIIKGEQIGVRIGLFNYWHENIEVIVMLHDSDDYKFVVVEEFGIVSSYNPRLLRGDIQTMVYLSAGAVVELQIPVLPQIDGCVTVRISANSHIYGDYEEIESCSTYDGVTNFLHTPYFIDLVSSGSLVLPDLEIPVPELFIRPQERQHLYVPGSQSATVGIVGDVVGPGIIQDFLDAENTLRKPYGAAENVLYNLAFNLYNLKYLRATNQMGKTEDGLQNRILNQMNVALQRITSYMNPDGSFSQFRDYQDFTPSTWVTAFALRTLQDANERDWELTFFIETELLNRIGGWLCRQTDPSGAFVENAPLYDRKMWSNNTDINGEERKSNISLTAYVVITMSLSDRLTGETEICRNAAIQRALPYLEQALPNIKDVYELSIVTYALHVAGSSERTKAFYDLADRRRTSPYVYWANKPVPPNEVRMVDTIPYYQPRRLWDNEGHAVEGTAYGLLTYLRRNLLQDATPIMRWLQTMRNSFYAQASTQDSIMALVALVEYAKLDTNRALYNIEVRVEATSMGNFSYPVRLNSDNWPIQQHVDINPVFGSVRGRAMGTGIALMQLATQVNVEYPHQIRPAAEGHFFDVWIQQPFNFTGRNFSIFTAQPCAKWVATHISPYSGMVAMEMDIPTGYVVTNDVLRALAQSGEVPYLRRAEQYARKVVFYFDQLSSAETCVKFRMDRWFPVANMTIQHKLRVYDYYEPGMHNTSLYNTWNLFNLHICRVCGSFQCPFCRYFNSAATIQASLIFSLTVSIVAFLTKNILTGIKT